MQTAVLFNDGPLFLAIARAIDAGDWASALSHPYHPFYPMAIHWMQRLIPNWEQAAVAVSILSGGISVAAMVGLVREFVGKGLALCAGLLLAVHPYAIAFSSDVQSEGIYSAFFLGGMFFVARASTRQSWLYALIAGLCSGVAYLIRPEGLGVAVIGCGLAAWFYLRRGWPLPRVGVWVLALLVGAAVVLTPYVVQLHEITGQWTLTQKKSVLAVATLGQAARPRGEEISWQAPGMSAQVPADHLQKSVSTPEHFPSRWEALGDLAHSTLSALRYEYLFLILLAAFATASIDPRYRVMVVATLLLYGIVLVGLVTSSGYVSRRHTLMPSLMLMGYAALGLGVLGRLLVSAIPPLRSRAAQAAWTAPLVALLLFSSVTLTKALRPNRSSSLAERQAAEWLHSQGRLGAVAAGKRRIAYYAKAAHVPLRIPEGVPLDQLLFVGGASYVVVDQAELDDYPGLRSALQTGWKEISKHQAAGRVAAVFERSPALGQGGD